MWVTLRKRRTLLTRCAPERLFYRLSVSDRRGRFILKGQCFLSHGWLIPLGAPRDLDLLGQGDNEVEAIAETLHVIRMQAVYDDGVVFDVSDLTATPSGRRQISSYSSDSRW